MLFIKPWLSKKSNWAVVASGLLMGLAAPGVGWFPLVWVALVPAFWSLWQAESWKKAAVQGVVMGCVYHAIVFLWFLGLHPLAWMGFSNLMSVVVAMGAWVLAFTIQGLIIGLIWVFSYLALKHYPKLFWIVLPGFWVGGLWFLNQQSLGVPFGFLAYSQAGVDSIRASAYAITFWGLEGVIVLVNLLLYHSLQSRKPLYGLVAVVLMVCLVKTGHKFAPEPTTVFESLRPVAIQGNLSIEAEQMMGSFQEKRQYYQAWVDQALAHVAKEEGTFKGLTAVLLPEGVMTLRLQDSYSPYVVPSGHTMMAGGLYQTDEGEFNGALVFDANNVLQQRFGKRYLVAFGETTPIVPEPWVQWIARQFGARYQTGFSEASLQQPLLDMQGYTIGPFICFEALYPNLSYRYRMEKADLLVTLSSLRWFHRHPFLERQFLAMNRFRATEAGIPLVLVTNTGVSAIIDNRGRILHQAGSGKPQVITLNGVYHLFERVN